MHGEKIVSKQQNEAKKWRKKVKKWAEGKTSKQSVVLLKNAKPESRTHLHRATGKNQQEWKIDFHGEQKEIKLPKKMQREQKMNTKHFK